MIEISLNNVVKNYGFNNVLDGINFEIKTNEKVALIGENGCGKTTIFNLITKSELPSKGDVFISRNSRIGILKQNNNDIKSSKLVKELLYDSFEEINIIKKKLDRLEEKMLSASNHKLSNIIVKYSKFQEEFINLGGYEIDTKIDKIVSAFNVSELLDKKYEILSGGEKTIINLMVHLLKKPDILLLDEPTNHLDISMIKWLEDYLNNYKGTVIIVSHDRYFLDKVVNKIILIENGKAQIFHGNYSYFVKENDKRILSEFNEYKDNQKKIEAMKKSIKKLKEFGKLAYPCGEMFFKRANSIQKRLDKMEVMQKPKISVKIPLNFNVDNRTGKDVLIVKDFDLEFFDKVIFSKASFEVYYKERVCIIGKNGSGKSSIIKAIISKNNSIKFAQNLAIGYIPQEFSFEDENISILEEASKYFHNEECYLRSALSKFMFNADSIYKRLNKLSGGERVRLKLFCIMQENNNLLILDEVTNHIDITTKEVLEDALNSYQGTVLFVSHDRYFINNVATKIVLIENNKLITCVGNYDDNFNK